MRGFPLVFVTVGTDHHRFDRLVNWVDDWFERGGGDRARVFVQSGTAEPPRSAEWAALIPHGQMQELLTEAVAVVCHGGPASITECREAGIVPIVVPRQHALGEHVDDHQVRFARRMAELGKIHLAESGEGLAHLLDRALSWPHEFRFPEGADGVEATVAAFERLVDGFLEGAS